MFKLLSTQESIFPILFGSAQNVPGGFPGLGLPDVSMYPGTVSYTPTNFMPVWDPPPVLANNSTSAPATSFAVTQLASSHSDPFSIPQLTLQQMQSPAFDSTPQPPQLPPVSPNPVPYPGTLGSQDMHGSDHQNPDNYGLRDVGETPSSGMATTNNTGSPNVALTVAMSPAERKAAHNAIERRYRNSINDTIALQKEDLESAGASLGKKPNKARILSTHSTTFNSMMNHIKTQSEAYIHILNAHNIPIPKYPRETLKQIMEFNKKCLEILAHHHKLANQQRLEMGYHIKTQSEAHRKMLQAIGIAAPVCTETTIDATMAFNEQCTEGLLTVILNQDIH